MPVAIAPTRDALLRTARTLPPAPQVLGGLCELLQDINTDLEEIANQIRMDVALAGRVIRVSNSVVYGGRGSVASVDEAVSRVGFSEVVRLVGTATAAGLVDQDLQCYHVPVDVFREALLMHALASEALAEVAGLDRRTAYVGGLLRGIGMMVLDRFARDRLAPEDTFDPGQFPTYRDWETARFGLTAVEVTTMALDEWRLPPDLLGAIDSHLQPRPGEDESDRLAHVLNLAGAISIENGRALPGEVMHWLRTPTKTAGAGLDEERFASAMAQACAEFEQQRNALY